MAQDKRLAKANRVLDEEIAALQEKAAQNKKRRPRQPVAVGVASKPSQAVNGPHPVPPAQPVVPVPEQPINSTEQAPSEQMLGMEFLDTTTEHLMLIKNLLNTDHGLMPLVAKAVGVEEGKYLRRNLMLNVLLSTVFLIAGWLLSIIATPTVLGHIFGH